MAIFVLTGTPGTGKSSIANYFAKKKSIIIDLNKLVNKKHLWYTKEKGSKVVDIASLQREVIKEIFRIKNKYKHKISKESNNVNNIIIEGHLACEITLPVDAVIVLRTRPDILVKRLIKRKYPKYKISENVQVEIIDYCTRKAEENYNCPIYEIDSSGSIRVTINKINTLIKKILNRDKIVNSPINWMRYAFNKEVAKYLFE
ncbi:MAG: AAA family ATPase [Candidatus Micrarchaeia archaeon]